MDPLSGVASVIAVVTLAAQVSVVFASLRDAYNHLPGRLHILNNEVTDLAAVLNDVGRLSAADVASLPIRGRDQTSIPYILHQLKAKLAELKTIVEALARTGRKRKIPLQQARAWTKFQGRLETLEEEIRTYKGYLNVVLGASNSRDLLHIRLDVETISTNTMVNSQLQSMVRDDVLGEMARNHTDLKGSLTSMYQQWDERMAKLERTVISQAARVQQHHAGQIDSSYSDKPPISPIFRPRNDAVGFRLRPYTVPCRAGCRCACHQQTMGATPAILERVIGQLFVGYSGVPFLKPTCDDPLCEKPLTPQLNLEYWFPIGLFWSLIIQICCSYQSHLGPSFQVKTIRRVPDNATCVEFAIAGNTEGLKYLFKRGLASPRDWALYTKRFETCTFLLHEGADPDYGTYGPNTASLGSYKVTSKDRARSMLLEPGLSSRSETALRLVVQDEDWIEECDFTLVHRAVVGKSKLSIEDAISQHPFELNATDAGGRTPLAWAALRRDDKAVSLLLDHGADPNVTENHGSTPLYNAAENGSAMCCRLLLKAGAQTDPKKAKGAKLSSALVAAAIDGKEPLTAKYLLDSGADSEACGPDGKTALIHAARMDNVSYASLLLDHGANINPTTAAGETPLTTAITYNSHNVLRVLLGRWIEYKECPRHKGLHLLPIVARYADYNTISLLIANDHIRLKYDKRYSQGSFAKQLRERFDASEELMLAFKELVTIINNESTVLQSSLNDLEILESGLLERLYLLQPQEAEVDTFEDALEDLSDKFEDAPENPDEIARELEPTASENC